MRRESEFDAVYENGVLRPAEALPLPEHARVRVTLRPLPATPSLESQASGLNQLREISASGLFRMNGRRVARDEMHERD